MQDDYNLVAYGGTGAIWASRDQPAAPAPASVASVFKVVGSNDTNFSDSGRGNTIYLDRHNIDCKDNAIKRFRLVNNGGDQIKYEVTCSSGDLGPSTNKNTGANDWGGGNSIYLDRHNIDCGSDSVLSQFRLSRPAGNQIRYDYTCKTSNKPLTCRDATTPANDLGGGSTIYFDRHDVTCNDDEVLSNVSYTRPSGNQIAYKYKCCKTDSDTGKNTSGASGSQPQSGFIEKSLKVKHSGKCLDVADASQANGFRVHQWDCHGGDNQKWTYDSNTGQIKVKHSGKCLDVAEVSQANGFRVHQWDCHGGDNQKWTYDSNTGQIKVKHSGKCLDVADASLENGFRVHQWDCHGGDNQKWTYDSNTGQIKVKHSGKCLDVAEASQANGFRVHQWDCHGGDNQKWNIV
jgi:hypothetical protein